MPEKPKVNIIIYKLSTDTNLDISRNNIVSGSNALVSASKPSTLTLNEEGFKDLESIFNTVNGNGHY